MRILVIGTNRFSHYKLISDGHRVVLLTKLQSAFATDLKNDYEELHFLSNSATSDDLVASSIALHQQTPFDVVASFHDDYQEIAVEVCHILHLPSLYTKAEIAVCREKGQARKRLKNAGLSKVEFFHANSVANIVGLLKEFPFPCIVKPQSGTASLGVFPIHALQDVACWQESQQDKPEQSWIVESYVDGPEFSIEAFSENGCHRIVAITEQFKQDGSFVECGHVVPARLTADEWDVIAGYVSQVLTCLEINNGPTHTEVKLTPDGPEFIETHTRTAGDRIPELVSLACGVDLNELAAQQVLGHSVLDKIPQLISFSSHASIAFKFVSASRPSVVEQIENYDLLVATPDVKDIKLYKEVGSGIHEVLHCHDRAAHVICIDDNATKAVVKARRYVETLVYHLREELHSDN